VIPRLGPQLCLLLATAAFCFCSHAFGQRVSFGVVTGINVVEDYRSGSVFQPSLGTCPEPICNSATLFRSADASSRFIIGPKVELRVWNRFSVEAEGLHRAVRRKETSQYIPPILFPNGFSLGSRESRGTDYTWEFPVLANQTFGLFKTNSFVEFGPNFRPAQNNKRDGLTAGVGVELRAKSFNLTPRIRYTHWFDKNYGPDPLFRLYRPRPNEIALIMGISRPSASPAFATAFGKDVTLGAVAGAGLTDDFPSTTFLLEGVPAARSFSDSRSPVLGMMVELEALKNLFVEINGLYRPLHITDKSLISVPEDRISAGQKHTVTVLTWEFPFLAKYKFRLRGLSPFIELGPSLRATGNLNATNPSHYGMTAGVGIEALRRKVKILPILRYSRWATDETRNTPTNRNQLEVLSVFSF